MSEPISLSALMAKYAFLIAGFIGALLSLSFVKALQVRHIYAALVTGAATAHYGTPLVGHFLGLPASVLPGIGFLIGVMGMNLIPALLKLSAEVARSPVQFIKTLIKR